MRRGVIMGAGALFLLSLPTVWLVASTRERDEACIVGRFPRECARAVRDLAGQRLTSLRCIAMKRPGALSFMADSLTIAAELYLPVPRRPVPAVVLLHGSSVYGRNLPLMRILAHQFRKRGYAVLLPDLRGYGQSDDPRDLRSVAAFDFARDVQAALDLLTADPRVDTTRLYLVGHSFGAGVALAAQARDPRVRAAVLLGPPRRLTERTAATTLNADFLTYRAQEEMRLPERPDFALWQQVWAPLNIENYVGPAARNVPLFLIDSEHEDQADLLFLREIARRITSPVSYWTVPGTGHYLSTGRLAGLPCYDRRPVEAFVQQVDAWLRRA